MKIFWSAKALKCCIIMQSISILSKWKILINKRTENNSCFAWPRKFPVTFLRYFIDHVPDETHTDIM